MLDMNRSFYFILTLILLVTCSMASAQKGGYKLSFKIKGLNNAECYLANYYGNKQYIKDTAVTNASGEFTFSGDEALGGGIYLVVTPSKKYFEVVIDHDQHFYMECDTLDFVSSMVVNESEDNKNFYNYLKFLKLKI